MTDDVLDHSRRKFFHFGAAALFASVTPTHAMAQSVSNKLKIGVIGSGPIGGLWVKSGHSVLFSSRHPEELKPLTDSLGPLAKVGTVGDALTSAMSSWWPCPTRRSPSLPRVTVPSSWARS